MIPVWIVDQFITDISLGIWNKAP